MLSFGKGWESGNASVDGTRCTHVRMSSSKAAVSGPLPLGLDLGTRRGVERRTVARPAPLPLAHAVGPVRTEAVPVAVPEPIPSPKPSLIVVHRHVPQSETHNLRNGGH
jgi:hypothetical protein